VLSISPVAATHWLLRQLQLSRVCATLSRSSEKRSVHRNMSLHTTISTTAATASASSLLRHPWIHLRSCCIDITPANLKSSVPARSPHPEQAFLRCDGFVLWLQVGRWPRR
jgi:hypothetical protein